MPISGPGLGKGGSDVSNGHNKQKKRICYSQCSKEALCLFRGRRCWCRWPTPTPRQRPQANITKRRSQTPTFGHIILHSYITISQLPTRVAETAHHVLYDGVVDKVVETQAIRVLKFKFVVVCEEAEEVEGGDDLRGRGTVGDVLCGLLS